MRHLILADIHGYLGDLERALRQAECQGGWDEIWFLGDAIGRGGEPNECLDRLRQLNAICVQGNWERWALMDGMPPNINRGWQQVLESVRTQLTASNKAYIQRWPVEYFMKEHGFVLVHSEDDHYTELDSEAYLLLLRYRSLHVLFAHTHRPAIYHYNGESCRRYSPRPEILPWSLVQWGGRIAANPGSVALPRSVFGPAGRRLYRHPSLMIYDDVEKELNFLEIHADQ